jgi:hypothetical protein
MIQKIQIIICKKLTGQITDRQTLSSLNRGEKIVTLKIVKLIILTVTVIDDSIYKPERLPAGYLSSDKGFENFMIDRRKVFFYITFQCLIKPAKIMLIPSYDLMSPFADPVGIGVVNEGLLQKRADNIDQGMMNNPVPEWCCTDKPRLGFIDTEIFVCTRPPCFVFQLCNNLPEIVFKMCIKMKDRSGFTLAFCCFSGC